MKKKRILWTALLMAALLCACNQAERVVEFPFVGVANTTDVVVERVECTDSATLLTMRVHSLPGRWIRVPSDAHLVAEGKKYRLTGSQGIILDEKLVIPEDKDTCFTLMSEPLPVHCQTFDYVGGEFEPFLKKGNEWRLCDIDLTGKTGREFPADLPTELQNVPNTDGLPNPTYAYAIGETTVNVHLLGYRRGICKEVKISLINTFEEQRTVSVKIDSITGSGSAKFIQYGTCILHPAPDFSNNSYGNIFAAPGETVELYVNLARGNNYTKKSKFPPIQACWTRGSMYDALNNLPRHQEEIPDSMDVRIRFGMTADELTETWVNHYHIVADYINAQAWHPWIKELVKVETFNDALFNLILDDRHYSEGGRDYSDDFVHDEILPEHFDRLFALADPDNHWLLLAPSDVGIAEASQRTTPELRNETFAQWAFTYDAVKKAYQNELTDEELQQMRSWKNPFYANMCADIQKRTLEAIEKGAKD